MTLPSRLELEARLERFVAENPRLRDRYEAMSKAELIRKLMIEKMERVESVTRRNRVLEQWASENPEIIDKVAQRVKKLAAEERPRFAITQSVKPERPGPRMGL
jgi:uncharacterized membrane-anchored protein YjiN (DUF445 family)